VIKNIRRVEIFAAILNYELSTAVLLFLQNNFWIAIPLIIAAAFLFTPYMLHVFIAERHFGWILAFLIIVIVPAILLYAFSKDSYAFEGMMLIPFIFFYTFCLMVRLSVNQWIKKYNWHIFYEEQKKEQEQRAKEWVEDSFR
jgi:hypothetical protein